jgi:hypothetical protein
MGIGNINSATDGTTIPSAHHNSLKDALCVDVVPRNVSGVVTNEAGSLGSSTFVWLYAFMRRLFIGDPIKNNSVWTEPGGDIVITRNNIDVCSVLATGLFGLATNSVGNSQMQDNSVNTNEIVNNAVTNAKRGLTVGQQISSSCGNFSTSSDSFVDVTNLSVSITTLGRPVMVFLQPVADSNIYTPNDGSVNAKIRITRDGVEISQFTITGYSASYAFYTPSMLTMDVVAAGSYNYKLQAIVENLTNKSVYINNYKLVAYEL